MIELDNFQESTRTFDSNAILLAGPGAGKTRTLAAKIEYLRLEKKMYMSQIKVLTFSKEAKRELVTRLPYLGDYKCVETFHAFSLSILKRSGYKPKVIGMVQSDSIFDERKGLICEYLEASSKEISSWGSNQDLLDQVRDILGAIDKFKAVPDTYLPGIYRPAYEFYQKRLKEVNLIDFNDMLTMAISETRKAPPKFKWLLIDEGHDTSMLQYELIKNIKVDKIWGVFSPHQMIYRWNGADERNIARFREDYCPTEFSLLNNWRSCPQVVDLLEHIYKSNLVSKGPEEGKVEFIKIPQASQLPHALELCRNSNEFEILARTNIQLKGFKKEREALGMKGKIGTIHWSKGTEAEDVVLLGAESPFIPNRRSMDLEEERNLLYVACSRAKKNLYILFEMVPTRFFGGYR